jgi:DNA-directed RNA polymerase specialized sigma24 family protein
MPSEQPRTGDLPPVTELVDTLCDRFVDAWRGAAAPTLAPFLPEDGAVRAAALVPLLCIDLEMRLRAGEAARAEAYLERFPELLAESPEDLLDLDAALTRLAAEQPDKARLVQLRFFAGLSTAEAAGALGVSEATAERWWAFARAWLYRELQGGGEAENNIASP